MLIEVTTSPEFRARVFHGGRSTGGKHFNALPRRLSLSPAEGAEVISELSLEHILADPWLSVEPLDAEAERRISSEPEPVAATEETPKAPPKPRRRTRRKAKES